MRTRRLTLSLILAASACAGLDDAGLDDPDCESCDSATLPELGARKVSMANCGLADEVMRCEAVFGLGDLSSTLRLQAFVRVGEDISEVQSLDDGAVEFEFAGSAGSSATLVFTGVLGSSIWDVDPKFTIERELFCEGDGCISREALVAGTEIEAPFTIWQVGFLSVEENWGDFEIKLPVPEESGQGYTTTFQDFRFEGPMRPVIYEIPVFEEVGLPTLDIGRARDYPEKSSPQTVTGPRYFKFDHYNKWRPFTPHDPSFDDEAA